MFSLIIMFIAALITAVIAWLFPNNNFYLIGLIAGVLFLIPSAFKLNKQFKKLKLYKNSLSSVDEKTKSLYRHNIFTRLSLLCPLLCLGVLQMVIGMQIMDIGYSSYEPFLGWVSLWLCINALLIFCYHFNYQLPEYIANFDEQASP
ncbi:hypothetical protein [Acinetobacter larvae]|uniref:Uncharacterized protein n=1 Tax=Acinetobacter larvae TaxID=1789224 RepID=A0A1B2LXT8_9GAMM|nr:hypothetical protein [Acinetobacter larvae]AOA57751.1 hypothetical protein BFG52_04855 [Acinetobacter larvae]